MKEKTNWTIALATMLLIFGNLAGFALDLIVGFSKEDPASHPFLTTLYNLNETIYFPYDFLILQFVGIILILLSQSKRFSEKPMHKKTYKIVGFLSLIAGILSIVI